jgi:outer membrane lipase/esterase
MAKRHTAAFLVGLTATLAFTPAAAQQASPHYSSLTVFGDSLVDAGNIAKATGNTTPNPAQGYFQGRFTNGYDYTDLLSFSLFGQYTVASANGGTNFAYGGARASTTSGVPDLVEQLGIYNGYLASGHSVDAGGLYIFNFGGNDVFNAPANDAAASTFLQSAANTYAQGVQALNNLGVRNILITGLPVANDPYLSRSIEAEGYLTTSLANLLLAADTTLYRFSYLDFFARVQSDPGSLGLPPLDTSTNCIAAGAQASGCAGIFSFDGTHPTAAVQTALFNDLNRQFALTSAVPEPATWGMMLVGLGAAGIGLRRAKRRSDDKFNAKIQRITLGAVA